MQDRLDRLDIEITRVAQSIANQRKEMQDMAQTVALVALVTQKAQIYLSGPMSGLPELNYPEFANVTERLRSAGRTVLSPHEIQLTSEPTWVNYMREALAMLLRCENIVMLPGFEKSEGAKIELTLARQLKMRVGYWRGYAIDWVDTYTEEEAKVLYDLIRKKSDVVDLEDDVHTEKTRRIDLDDAEPLSKPKACDKCGGGKPGHGWACHCR